MQTSIWRYGVLIIAASLGCSHANRVARQNGNTTPKDKQENPVLTDAQMEELHEQEAILEEMITLYLREGLVSPKNITACIREMFAMQSLGECRDRFTYYLPPRAAQAHKQNMSGSFGGIGIELAYQNKQLIVISVFPDGPAFDAGVMVGDVLLKVDGHDVTTLQDATVLLRGKDGTEVTLLVARTGNAQPLTITVKRGKIVVRSVDYRIQEDIGVIHIKSFLQNTFYDFKEALYDLERHHVRKVVIDVRDNRGGSLDQTIMMLALFMERTDIVVTVRYRKTITKYDYMRIAYMDIQNLDMEDIGRFHDMDVVVLVNGRSASASEIFAGTMKDWGYQIVGEVTFKKGVGQAVFDLADGSMFVLTTFEFLVGNTRTVIRDQGVTPTVTVSASRDATGDVQLQKAIEMLGQQ